MFFFVTTISRLYQFVAVLICHNDYVQWQCKLGHNVIWS